MRTLIFILGGFALLAACLGAARLASSSLRAAVGVFLVLWFLVAAGNMWLGVAKAGYSVSEELPVFLLLFGLPAAAALLLRWKFL